MCKAPLILVALMGVTLFCVLVLIQNNQPKPLVTDKPAAKSTAKTYEEVQATERYTALVDRVHVGFEHWDYTQYRLQTNDLV